MNHTAETTECRRRIALGASLNTLLNHNPDFKAVVVDGLFRDEILARSLNINADESGTIEFLKSAAVLKKYLDRVRAEADQAQIDLENYLNM